ncbi:MAG: hypothetical protein GY810_15885 [Aureispira sp.]|nr:hypothetical protein [Aureispira sp.]
MAEIDRLNTLLANQDTKNQKLAFQLLRGEPALIKEVYPLLLWRIRTIDFNSFYYDGMAWDNEEELTTLKTLISKQEKDIPKIAECRSALNILFMDIGWEDEWKVGFALRKFEPYRIVYENYLGSHSTYQKSCSFIANKCMKHELHEEAYPFFKILLKESSLSIHGKIDFTETIVALLDLERELDKQQIRLAVSFMNEAINKFPDDNIQYYITKAKLLSLYLDSQKEAIECYEQCDSLNPKNIKVLNNLAWLLFKHTDRWQEAYEYSQKAINLEPNNVYVLNTMAHLELSYCQNKQVAKSLLNKALELDPYHLDSEETLEELE